MASSSDGFGGQRRFSGDTLDPQEYRRWRLWALAKMAATKDMAPTQRGPFVFCLLDGLALETVEHLTLDKMREENGDKHIWQCLDERFPDKLAHDHMAECLKEIFELHAQEGETTVAWCSRVQEAFAKCRRKVQVDFPAEARGWVCLNASGLSADQRAIVTAKTQGDLKMENIMPAMRSCFPDFKAGRRVARGNSAYVVQHDETEDEPETGLPFEAEGPDSVVFEEVEAFLADHGFQEAASSGTSTEVYDESEIAEVLAATWREKRTEISKLQKARKFKQASTVKKQFSRELTDIQKRSRCRRCGQIGHWARSCPQAQTSGYTGRADKEKVSGAAMVTDEVLLVSSPGFGIIDSGCSRTLIGQQTLGDFMRLYQDRRMSVPESRPQQNLFRFGNGQEELSEKVVSMPVIIHGQSGRIEAAVIKGKAPLLLSRNTLKSLGAKLDFVAETVELQGGPPQQLQTNAAGQFVLNVLDDQGTESLLVEEESTEEDQEQIHCSVEHCAAQFVETDDHSNIEHCAVQGVKTDSNIEQQSAQADDGEQFMQGPNRVLTCREHRCLLAHHEAWTKGKKTGCAVAELFSPPRFSELAEARGEKGLSFDIKQGWDLLDTKTQAKVDELLEKSSPELLICCPECKHWGGWYRLNKHKLSLAEQLHNQRVAQKQADFCVAQIKRQLKRGGRVLIEHPWSSDLWKYPPMQKLLQAGKLTVHKANMCAYGLVDPNNKLPMLKPTGLAVSHSDMKHLAMECPGHDKHQGIVGHTHLGNSRSALAAEYTKRFVKTWYSCIRPQDQLCVFACVQDSPIKPVSSEGAVQEVLAAEVQDPQKVQTLLRKLHNNLGHPSTRTLVRILKHAGGSEQALKLAEQIEEQCDICQQRQRPTPALPTSPEKPTEFNHRVGWDVKNLPGWQVNQKVKCMNIVDFATSFQVMIPFFEKETSEVLKTIYLEAWQRWAGPPVEVITDPARTNQAESVFQQLERDGIRVLSSAAEAHSQLGKVEKHGHLFEVILQKVIDQVQPRNRQEYEQCIVQTTNAKNELLNQHGLSPCQLVFGRNPRVPDDLLQEWPCPVSGTASLSDDAVARSQLIRTQARTALIMSQDDKTLRTALNARPRVERDFIPGDYVAYWRTQKYEKGVRLVGGRWFGVAVVMGRVGRNYLIYHRKNMFKVAPEHLRHVTAEERVLAQTDGRELLGLNEMLENKDKLGTQFIDLTGTPTPMQLATAPEETEDVWFKQGDLLRRIHKRPRSTLFVPDPNDPVLTGISLENWRRTIRSDTKETIVHQIWSNPSCQNMSWGESSWKGESQFRIRPRREQPITSAAVPVSQQAAAGLSTAATPNLPSTEETPKVEGNEQTKNSSESPKGGSHRWSPLADDGQSQTTRQEGYGPVRLRQQKGPPLVLLRPPEMKQDDLMEVLEENHGTKRSLSPEGQASAPSKHVRTDEDECLLSELVHENGPAPCVEVLIANFLQKKLQKELHHSNNPPMLQEKIDRSKTTEWTTLRDEKNAIKVLPPSEAKKIRERRPDRIMTSRFVIVEKHEDGDSKIKSRWCLRGHHDPDLLQKVLAGKCHSPTLSQFGRSLILQVIVSHRWVMHLGDIKGAFLEANVRDKALLNPVFAELPPGGVPGVAPGSLVQVLGNIYGANDAPHEWYCEFDKVAIQSGFTRSKFDSCLYLCHGEDGKLQGVLGAHVDDTITGGAGSRYESAIEKLRQRFPFRKWRSGTGEFLGTVYEQDSETFEIKFAQKEYAEHIQPIRINKERSQKPWLPATSQEVSALRAVNGALSWLSTQTRPDLAVQTSQSQQCFPNPTVQDLWQANQAVRRARQQSDLQIRVPFIPPSELTLCFWSDAAFANTDELKTQGGWLVGFTSDRMRQGTDVPVHCFAWKSYRLPRVVSSTMGGEAQAFSTASGMCEWISLMLAECLDGPFLLEDAETVLLRRKPIGMTDCRSLFDHLNSLGSGGVLDDRRTAIDIAIIRQSIRRTGLEARWVPTGHMIADGLTKDRAEPMDLLRSVIRAAKYQLADEQLVLDRKKEERERRKQIASRRAEAHKKKPGQVLAS